MTATATVHRNASLAALLATPLALSACGGGGGGGVNSAATAAPPVATAPTPTPAPASAVSVKITTIPSPATRPGVYDTIARVDRYLSGSPPGESRSRLAASGEVKITAYQPISAPYDVSYTVQFAQPDLPAGLASLATVVPGQSYDASPNGSFGIYGRDASRGQYPIKFGQDFAATVTNSDGSQRTILSDRYANAAPDGTNATLDGKRFYHNATVDVGLSYVAFGSWAWGIDDPQSAGGNRIEAGVVRLVYGDRTPAGALPTTGRASYTATAAGIGGGFASNSSTEIVHEALRFALVADFGQRSISTRITQDFKSEAFPDGDRGVQVLTTPGFDLSGTGSLASAESFSIPLTGTMTGYDPRNSQLPVFSPTTFVVFGALDGAFFGPAAEQIGGVFAVGLSPGTSLYSDAFVGTRD